MQKISYKSTRRACYIGYITQAINCNLAPLFYVIFGQSFGITRTQIGQIILFMFVVQLAVDLASVKLLPRFGVRKCCVASHILAAAGLVMLSVLPRVMPPFAGILLAILTCSVGSGLIEVVISPVVNALPKDNASSHSLAFLHSFYCWGQAGVVLISTGLMAVIGVGRWYILPVIWALIPFFNIFAFLRVPLCDIDSEDNSGAFSLLRSPMFLVAFVVMISSGASELAVSQWASYFAEAGLGVSKAAGDIFGPCLFAVLMAFGRVLYGVFGERLNIRHCLMGCGVITVMSYAVAVFSPWPALSLGGCALCGLGVSLMWPGTLDLAAMRFPKGGSALFALLAFGGDIGCSAGPFITGLVSDAATSGGLVDSLSSSLGMSAEQIAIKLGLLAVTVFPILLIVGVSLLGSGETRQKQ